MRSKLINPPETFMSLLRKAGYYVDWPGKTDFNFDQADPKAATFAPIRRPAPSTAARTGSPPRRHDNLSSPTSTWASHTKVKCAPTPPST